MNRLSATFTLVMCACGLLLGHTLRKSPEAADPNRDNPVDPLHVRSGSRRPAAVGSAHAPALPHLRSGQTLESLIALGPAASYADLTVWLVDADAAQIASYWESCKDGKLDGDRERLIFLNWTRLDPQAAIAAVAGTNRAGMPWWAWAASDPEAAMASGNGERLKDVARGIGEFQPKWLMRNFDRIPESVRQDALGGLMTWKENEDPVATLDFLKQQGITYNASVFRTLCLKDPWAAYDWIQENGGRESQSHRALDTLLETMKSTHPDDLDRLAAMTPPGQTRRKVEDFVFASLLERNPEEALKRAKEIEAPFVAVSRLGQVGRSLLATDPEKAFSIGADIFAAGLPNLNATKEIELGNGGSSTFSSGEDSPAARFIESLMAKDPERVMEMATAGTNGTVTSTFVSLCHSWSSNDLTTFSKWAETLPDPGQRAAAAGQAVAALSTQGRFEEAAALATRDSAKSQGTLYRLASEWSRSNPEAAAAWLESADLEEDLKGQLRSFIGIKK